MARPLIINQDNERIRVGKVSKAGLVKILVKLSEDPSSLLKLEIEQLSKKQFKVEVKTKK